MTGEASSAARLIEGDRVKVGAAGDNEGEAAARTEDEGRGEDRGIDRTGDDTDTDEEKTAAVLTVCLSVPVCVVMIADEGIVLLLSVDELRLRVMILLFLTPLLLLLVLAADVNGVATEVVDAADTAAAAGVDSAVSLFSLMILFVGSD